MDARRGHLIFLAVPAWGHLRPMTDFLTKIVMIQAGSPIDERTIITLLTVGDYADRAKREISLASDDEVPGLQLALSEQIRVVSMGGEGIDFVVLLSLLSSQFPAYYEHLLSEEPVTCKLTGKVYKPAPRPTAAVIDLVAYPIVQAIQASKAPITIIAWMPTAASVMFRTVAPGKLGGLGDLESQITAIIGKKTDDEIQAIKNELLYPNKGHVVHIPGMPLFYDYEIAPQESSPYISRGDIVSRICQGFFHAKGVLVHSTLAYEPETIPAVGSWLETSRRRLFPVGPLVLLPRVSTGKSLAGLSTTKSEDTIKNFLDAASEHYGAHSVIYISFGSIYWPPKSEYVWAWLETLMVLETPFICSMASPLCTVIPETLRNQIVASGLGILTPWADQQAVLAHAATGWFMSHCGHSSIMESMSAGVPIIAWPGEDDQPFGAAYLSLTLKTAFELVQVRTGVRGMRPLYRGANLDSFLQPQGTLEAVRAEARDVIHRAGGEEGKMMRKNAETLKDKLRAAWDIGGDARKTTDDFVAQFCVA